jgi:hypothetical protein
MIVVKITHLRKLLTAAFSDIDTTRMEWATRRFHGGVRNCPWNEMWDMRYEM